MQQYLSFRNTVHTTNTTHTNAQTGVNVLVVAAAIEGVGSAAFSAGAEGFQQYLIKVSARACFINESILYIHKHFLFLSCSTLHTIHAPHITHYTTPAQLLYPLLELLVDSDAIVKQAALCTLRRVALYTEHTTLQGLVR